MWAGAGRWVKGQIPNLARVSVGQGGALPTHRGAKATDLRYALASLHIRQLTDPSGFSEADMPAIERGDGLRWVVAVAAAGTLGGIRLYPLPRLPGRRDSSSIRCGTDCTYVGFMQPVSHSYNELTRSGRSYRPMTAYSFLANAAWFRLGIVGLDILAVVATVRVCAALTAWWRTLHFAGRCGDDPPRRVPSRPTLRLDLCAPFRGLPDFLTQAKRDRRHRTRSARSH
jgi:hypothetical protein